MKQTSQFAYYCNGDTRDLSAAFRVIGGFHGITGR